MKKNKLLFTVCLFWTQTLKLVKKWKFLVTGRIPKKNYWCYYLHHQDKDIHNEDSHDKDDHNKDNYGLENIFRGRDGTLGKFDLVSQKWE